MINRFSKMRDSWFTKIILTITALSFMSLFGVSGYINTANSNKAVVKVDNIEISQSEFSYMLQRDINRLSNLLGAGFEIDGERKSQIATALLKTKVDEAILENTMRKYNIDFTENLIREIIFLMPQFQSEGKFDYDTYKWYLNNSGKTEQELIRDIKHNVAHKVLLDSQVAYINVPKIQLEQMAKVIGQRRTFKYVKIENAKANITRIPTSDELDQYYDDLSEELMIPEKRDLSVMYIPEEKLTEQIEIPQEEIDAYYKDHIEEFQQPEKRLVSQLIFDDKNKADDAHQLLMTGADFTTVAELNGQNTDEISLGFVSSNDVSDELSEVIFNLDNGQISEPKEIAENWQILQVSEIKPASQTPRSVADAQIKEELRQDKSYDNNYEIVSVIEDKIGSGISLADLATAYNTSLLKVKALGEDGKTEDSAGLPETLLSNKDLLDIAFSYNEGEIGQVVETENGIAVVMVDKIIESHQQPRDEAQDYLKKVWLENERSAITQELVDNIEHDLEAGDDLSSVAKRYNLTVMNSRPATRDETIDKISFVEMKKLFTTAKNEPQIVKVGDDYIVAETSNIYDDSASIRDDKKEELKQSIYDENIREAIAAMLNDYAHDYKIEVNYNRIGLND